jgi:hypothetical protein
LCRISQKRSEYLNTCDNQVTGGGQLVIGLEKSRFGQTGANRSFDFIHSDRPILESLVEQ